MSDMQTTTSWSRDAARGRGLLLGLILLRWLLLLLHGGLARLGTTSGNVLCLNGRVVKRWMSASDRCRNV
jgi:hypothetical protein